MKMHDNAAIHQNLYSRMLVNNPVPGTPNHLSICSPPCLVTQCGTPEVKAEGKENLTSPQTFKKRHFCLLLSVRQGIIYPSIPKAITLSVKSSWLDKSEVISEFQLCNWSNHRIMEWFGLEGALDHPMGRNTSIIPGCSKPCPGRPWALPGLGQPQQSPVPVTSPWATRCPSHPENPLCGASNQVQKCQYSSFAVPRQRQKCLQAAASPLSTFSFLFSLKRLWCWNSHPHLLSLIEQSSAWNVVLFIDVRN